MYANTNTVDQIVFQISFPKTGLNLNKMKLSLFLPLFADSRVYRPKQCVKKGDALREMRGAALEMGWQMVKNNMDENVALSPVSISGALHMLAAGSG